MGLKGNAIIGQSGGPTSVINASLSGVIKEAVKHNFIHRLYGSMYGIEGILNENFVDLFQESRESIHGLRKRPGAVLGGCRYRICSEDIDDSDIKKIFEVFKKLDVHSFFYIGGNDSMDTANKIFQASKKLGYDLQVIGIPKTIDNDLVGTDHCPGYGSCSKYLITSVMEAGIHTKSMATSEPVTIMVTVGRNAGWLPAATCLAKRNQGDAPHIVCFPEVPFYEDAFLEDVERVYRKEGSVFIVTGEGLTDTSGKFISASFGEMAVDTFGHPELGSVAEAMKQMIENKLKLKTRWIKPDICQQAAMHLASVTDIKEAEMCGKAAVKFAEKGMNGVMVTMKRLIGETYKIVPGMIELSSVANIDRMVPREFINQEGNFVSQKFIEYMKPLISGTVKIKMENGFPVYPNLKLVRI